MPTVKQTLRCRLDGANRHDDVAYVGTSGSPNPQRLAELGILNNLAGARQLPDRIAVPRHDGVDAIPLKQVNLTPGGFHEKSP